VVVQEGVLMNSRVCFKCRYENTCDELNDCNNCEDFLNCEICIDCESCTDYILAQDGDFCESNED
jgi:hypothetical protein